MASTNHKSQAGSPMASRTVRTRALTVLAAAGAALLVWIVAVPLLGIELRVQPGGRPVQTIGVAAVLGTSAVAALAGWGLLALLERWISRARSVWTAVAVAVLVLSLSGPLGGAATAQAAVAVTAMHLAVGAVVVTGLRRTPAADLPAERETKAGGT